MGESGEGCVRTVGEVCASNAESDAVTYKPAVLLTSSSPSLDRFTDAAAAKPGRSRRIMQRVHTRIYARHKALAYKLIILSYC